MSTPPLIPSLLLAIPLLASIATLRANPIPITGCNCDVIYEAGATGGGNGTFLNETTALYEEGLAPAPNDGTGIGLPGNRQIPTLNGGDFQLFPYAGPNALIVSEDGSAAPKFAVWNFEEAAKIPYSSLSVVGQNSAFDLK